MSSSSINQNECLPFIISRFFNEKSIRLIQDIVLWRRPFLLVFFLIIIEFLFFSIYFLDLETFSTFIYILLIFSIIRFVYSLFPLSIQKLLLNGNVSWEEKVWSTAEIAVIYQKTANRIQIGINWFLNYINQPNFVDHILFFGTSFLLYMMFSSIGPFWLIFVIVHSILIIPGIIHLIHHHKLSEYLSINGKTKID